jgi:hypothetical protein
MPVSYKHLITQAPVIAAMARAAVSRPNKDKPILPTLWQEAEIAPRPEALIKDYVRHLGGDPAWYRGTVPPHLFPEWSFPLAARAMATLPYPITRVINAGCALDIRGPLPAREPLVVRARIESIEADEKKALVTQRIVTGTRSSPEALVSDMRVFIPLGKGEGKSQKPAVPEDAREISFFTLSADAGLDFAKLTGDVNPIHWLRPYAKAAGFKACILHGFATLARAIEAMNRARFAGDPRKLGNIEARFVRPLLLPAKVGVYVKDEGIWVGDAPGGGAYLEGAWRQRDE